MYKCINCNKEFKYESELSRHKNRKIPCNNPKKEYKCEICNINFVRPSHKIIHEKTNKHIKNIQIYGNQNQIGNNNINNNSFNNIIQLTLNVNSFKNTDTSYLRKAVIEEIGEFIYIETMAKKYLQETDKVKILFDSVIEILERLHFNLDIEENHNLKILLIFPGIKKKVFEYLILEINPDTKEITWNSLTYEEILEKIFFHLYNLNNKLKNDNYDRFLCYLERYLINKKDIANELKPYIQSKLSEMYINFNQKQKKESRDIKENIEEKVAEYITYRNQECKLTNGYNPEIKNSNIK